MQKILESLKVSTTIAQAQWVERKPQDAYFAEAEVFGKRINVMIYTGAVGCIITKKASTNIQIVSVTGAKTAPLGKMFKVGVKIGKFEIKEDMIVTEASGYNVLLGNDWITNQAKAIINTEKQIMIIKQNKEIDTVPITCFTKINPEILSPIDFFEEEYDELELEDIEGEPQHYLNVSLEENIAIINHQRYPTEFLEFSGLEFQRTDKYWKGPGRCLCKPLQNNEKCSFCHKLYEDLEDYRVAKAQIEEDDELIEITKGKDAPIGSLTNVQRTQLQQLLTKNKDLFANDKSELTQTNVAQHSIITENDALMERLFKIINQLEDDRQIALNQIKEDQRKQKDRHDISATAEQFKIGDKVLVERTWLKNNFSAKLEERWMGPYFVHNVQGKNYKLRNMDGRL
ncbi:12233_t:CDS:2, partial [Funneliformis geosporum]